MELVFCWPFVCCARPASFAPLFLLPRGAFRSWPQVLHSRLRSDGPTHAVWSLGDVQRALKNIIDMFCSARKMKGMALPDAFGAAGQLSPFGLHASSKCRDVEGFCVMGCDAFLHEDVALKGLGSEIRDPARCKQIGPLRNCLKIVPNRSELLKTDDAPK